MTSGSNPDIRTARLKSTIANIAQQKAVHEKPERVKKHPADQATAQTNNGFKVLLSEIQDQAWDRVVDKEPSRPKPRK